MIKHPEEREAGEELINEIREAVPNAAFDKMTRILYSTDASIYQMIPAGVVFPRNVEEVSEAIKICTRYEMPVVPRGGGSSLAGQSIGHAVIIDDSKFLNKIIEIDREEKEIVVQPGITLGKMNSELDKYGLMFGPDPASGDRATIGGILANNATGAHSIVYGMCHDHVIDIEAIGANGERLSLSGSNSWEEGKKGGGIQGKIYHKLLSIFDEYGDAIQTGYPKTFRNVAGYNLIHLLNDESKNVASLMIGSEGTLGMITKARLNLVNIPKRKALAIISFRDIRNALESVECILESVPSAIEVIDQLLLNLAKGNREYKNIASIINGVKGAILIVEYSGESEKEVREGIKRLRKIKKSIKNNREIIEIINEEKQEDIWEMRKIGLGILMSMRGDKKPISFIEDAAIPVKNLSNYVNDIQLFTESEGVKIAVYGHASAGCLHIRPVINLKEKLGVKQLKRIAEESASLAAKYQGTISGEHGDGISRSQFLEKIYGEKICKAFKEVKTAFDPDNVFNPGKIVEPYQMDDRTLLRYGEGYHTSFAPGSTGFHFKEDGGFIGAVELCNGSGVCRKADKGVMCPSFQATRDEEHSTRGRANALRAAMMGWLGSEGIAEEELYKIMDLCLSCQACKTECPSRVDMSKLKAEVLWAYYKKHGTPIRAQVFGRINKIYKYIQPVSALVNFGNELIGKQAMGILGVHQERVLPRLENISFSRWYRGRKREDRNKKIVFFHDTFMEFNQKHVGMAAIKVIEEAGYEAIVLGEKKCCGRPALSKGLLGEVRQLAKYNIDLLYPYAERGIPIVGCEPSCVSMLTNEYIDLWPGEKAKAVSDHAMCIDRFINSLMDRGEIDFKLDEKSRNVLYHGHCHQKANYGTEDTIKMLERIPNCNVEEIDAGCCGMAGSFGYEKEHYDLSIEIAEMKLAPAIREASEDTIICASGTSCREQIEHTTKRKCVHPIEIVADALL